MMLKSQHLRTYGPADHGRPFTGHMANGAHWTEGYSYELIDGRLYVSPHANLPHDDIKQWLMRKLLAYCDRHPEFLNSVHGPARVFVPGRRKLTVPEPDIAAYRDYPFGIPIENRDWKDISPVLVAEVVSGDVAKDLDRNVVLYETVPSIEEYWIVNQWLNDDFFFRVFRKRGRKWGKPIDLKYGSDYTTKLLPGFSLRVKPEA